MIELMIATLLALLLTQGIYLLFWEANRVEKHQAGLSRVQENGRTALALIAADLRQAGHVPCGGRPRPMVYVDALTNHVTGKSPKANAPGGWPAGTSYPLDRGLLVDGSMCTGSTCTPALPAALGVPGAGLGDGDRVPGTDVLTVRSLRGTGWAVDSIGGASTCAAHENLGVLGIRKLPGDGLPAAFPPGHVALMMGCSAGAIFAVSAQGNALIPTAQNLGAPLCADTGPQTRVFDFDAQLQTTVYFLEVKARANESGRKTAVLMQRIDGVTNELVEGVERLDFRYSLVDAGGVAYWLGAADVEAGIAADGTALQCRNAADAVARPCSWADVDAVDVSMLVNTGIDLPADASANAFSYRYLIDGSDLRAPPAEMPVTGLAAGRMLRREFHAVVALRSFDA